MQMLEGMLYYFSTIEYNDERWNGNESMCHLEAVFIHFCVATQHSKNAKKLSKMRLNRIKIQ